MEKFKVEFLVVTFLVSAVTLSLPSLSEAGARGARGAAIRAPIVNPPGGAVGPAGVEAPRGNVVAGARVNVLPATARAVAISGTTYYVDGDIYYVEDDSSGEVVYVVVPSPE